MGQNLQQYRAQDFNARTQQRHTIYVAPLGPLKAGRGPLLEASAEYLDAYFDTRTKILEPIPLPLRAWDPTRRQYDARVILEVLPMYLPEDGLALVALTEVDLFIPSTHHVFGLGSQEHRTAAVSLRRLGHDLRLVGQRGTLLRRTLTAASHEVGHTLSMRHCTAFRCLMNGTNSLDEADAHPLHLCPECQRKAELSMGFHRQDRFARLLDFYERYGFPQEAQFVERRLDPPVVEFLPDPPPEAPQPPARVLPPHEDGHAH
jgi:archaemetzincin